MSDSARLSVAEELAELRTQLAELRGELATQAPSASPAGSGRLGRLGRPRVAAVAAVALAGVAFMGIATASTPGHPADVTFISLSVPHKILSNSSIGKAVTKSVLVIGGATTVPTDATSVQMTVAVKSTAAGSLSVFPADHASSATADTIAFPAGNVVVTQVSKQSPGLSSKVSFTNNGTAAAVVTVTITGYSTQTTASNISGSGGNVGDVLTNTGSGAAWQTLNFQAPDTATITIHPTTNAAGNGTKLLSAVNGLTPARTLIRLEPGNYDIGGGTLTLPDDTWIQGAGQGLSTIIGTGNPIVSTHGDVGLDRLSLSGSGAKCVDVASAGQVVIQFVTMGGCSYGVQVNAPAPFAAATITNSTITVANGRGVDLPSAGGATIVSSTISDSAGVGSGVAVAGNATARVSNSAVTGNVIGLLVSGSGATAVVTGSQLTGPTALNNTGTANIADTQLVGPAFTGGSSTTRCVGAYNASYVPLGSGCV